MLSFPSQRPDSESVASYLWKVQQDLLDQAERLLGPRDKSKKIYQPVFQDNGPYTINTPNMDGAFAALSRNAAGYWPTVVYELAHETVHLLNPIEGKTNWFEEGIAVAFAVEMSHMLTPHPMKPDKDTNYERALVLVKQLPIDCFAAAKIVRSSIGSFSSATVLNLQTLLPEADITLLTELLVKCNAR
ncbi:MAG: hypothetical protein JXB10_02460 [Pirellulales bacterium]|nr:hypothetical protein [Pirellulales bacterium]